MRVERLAAKIFSFRIVETKQCRSSTDLRRRFLPRFDVSEKLDGTSLLDICIHDLSSFEVVRILTLSRQKFKFTDLKSVTPAHYIVSRTVKRATFRATVVKATASCS